MIDFVLFGYRDQKICGQFILKQFLQDHTKGTILLG